MALSGSNRAWPAYGQSKLANLMFTFELQRRLRQAQASTLAASAPWLSQDAFHGALPLLRAAVDPAATGGEYFGPADSWECKGAPVLAPTSERSRDETAQRRLWEHSERLTGVVFPI